MERECQHTYAAFIVAFLGLRWMCTKCDSMWSAPTGGEVPTGQVDPTWCAHKFPDGSDPWHWDDEAGDAFCEMCGTHE